jgi:hypothetical protein
MARWLLITVTFVALACRSQAQAPQPVVSFTIEQRVEFLEQRVAAAEAVLGIKPAAAPARAAPVPVAAPLTINVRSAPAVRRQVPRVEVRPDGTAVQVYDVTPAAPAVTAPAVAAAPFTGPVPIGVWVPTGPAQSTTPPTTVRPAVVVSTSYRAGSAAVVTPTPVRSTGPLGITRLRPGRLAYSGCSGAGCP